MAMSTESLNPLTPDSLTGDNFHLTINKSLEDLLAAIRAGDSIPSRFVDVFYSLMQAKIDPPFESIWIHSALSHRFNKSSEEDPMNQVASAKALLQFISACSGPCSSSKSIGLLAPLVFQVYELLNLILTKESCSKNKKKAMEEVNHLINAMLGYMTASSINDLSQGNTESSDASLRITISDLLRVWRDSDTSLNVFFPLVSTNICENMHEEDFNINCLAGVVLAETFFLKLIMEIQNMSTGSNSERELRNWVVGSITGFCNPYFFDVLVKMLMEPKLPLHTHLLNSDQETVMRKILYDAIVLVDYSYLNINTITNLDNDLGKNLAILRLILTHKALESCRKNKDHKRASAYSNAFSTSRLCLQIKKWIKMLGGTDPIASSSPKDLVTELFAKLKKQGGRLIGERLLKYVNLAIEDTHYDYFKADEDDSQAFYIAKDEEESDNSDDDDEDSDDDDDDDGEDDEMMNSELIAAARSMNAGRKRKGRGRERSGKYMKKDGADSGCSDASEEESDV